VRRGSHTSVAQLEKALLVYLQQRNRDPGPFVWTADAISSSARSNNSVNESPTKDTRFASVCILCTRFLTIPTCSGDTHARMSPTR